MAPASVIRARLSRISRACMSRRNCASTSPGAGGRPSRCIRAIKAALIDSGVVERGGLGRLLIWRQLGTADDQQGRPEAAGQLQGDRRGDAPGPSRDQDRLARLEGGWRLLVRGQGGGSGLPGEATGTEVSHLHRSLTTAQFPEQRLGQLGRGIPGVQVDRPDEHLGPLLGQALDEPEHAAMPGHGGGRGIGLEPEPAPQAGRREQEGLAVPAGLPHVIAQGTGEQVERLDVTPGPAVPRLALDRLGQRRQVDQAADGPVLLPDTTEHVGHRLRVGQVGVESAAVGPEAGLPTSRGTRCAGRGRRVGRPSTWRSRGRRR